MKPILLLWGILIPFFAHGQIDSTNIESDTLKTSLNSVTPDFSVIDSVMLASTTTDSVGVLTFESSQLAISGNYTSVNGAEKYSFVTSGGLVYSFGEPYKLPVTASFIYSKVSDVLQQREISIVSMPTYKPSNGRFRYYGDVEFEQSYVRNIDARYSFGVGAGYLLIGKNKQNIDKSQLLFSSFILHESTSVNIPGADDNYIINAYRLSNRLKWRLLFNEKTRITITGFILYAPRFNAHNVYKLAGNTSVNYKVWKGLSIVLSYDYLSEQILIDGTRKTSTVASAGFSLTI